MAAPKKLPPWLQQDPAAAVEEDMPMIPPKKGGKKPKPAAKGKGKGAPKGTAAPKRKPPAKRKQ